MGHSGHCRRRHDRCSLGASTARSDVRCRALQPSAASRVVVNDLTLLVEDRVALLIHAVAVAASVLAKDVLRIDRRSKRPSGNCADGGSGERAATCRTPSKAAKERSDGYSSDRAIGGVVAAARSRDAPGAKKRGRDREI